MPKGIDFSALVRERDTFTDQDGTVHEFRSALDLGVVEMARAKRLQREMGAALDALGTNPEDVAAAGRFESGAGQMLQLILPTLPDARCDALTLGQKAQIVQWWGEQNRPGTTEGEAAADPPRGS